MVFGADHVYKMNVRQMVDFHLAKGALATIACLPVPVSEASQFGIVEIDVDGRVIGFQEKPTSNVVTIPGDPEHGPGVDGQLHLRARCPLHEALEADSQMDTHHDFGKDILPSLLKTERVFCYDFSTNRIPRRDRQGRAGLLARRRDHRGLLRGQHGPQERRSRSFNLYNWEWPIVSVNYPDPPSKLVFDDERRRGMLVQSIMSSGCVIAGGFVKDCVLGRNVWVDEGAEVRDSVLFDNVHVGQGRARPARHHRQERARRPRRPHRPRPGARSLSATTSARAGSPWSARPGTPGSRAARNF